MILLGLLFNLYNKLKVYSLKKYKTYLFKKHNPGILFVGADLKYDYIENILIGNNSYVNGGELIAGKDSKIVIGNDCMLSYDVVLRTDYHIHESIDISMIKQGIAEKDIIVGNDTWICQRVIILPGVTIGNHCIVGCGAVVTKDVPDYAVVGGVPAKILYFRNKKNAPKGSD